MSQLTVLAVSACEQGLLSAQLIFVKGGTQLQCGRTYSEAAEFLSRHPGTLVVCEGWSNSKSNECLSRLVREGLPSALILISIPDEKRVSVEVRLIRNDDGLRELVENLEVMRKIQLAWEYCKAACTEFSSIDEHVMRLPLM